MNEGTPLTKIFNISYWALLRVKLRIYSVCFTGQMRVKEGALRSHSWTLSILQRVHSLKTRRLTVNPSTVYTCSYTCLLYTSHVLRISVDAFKSYRETYPKQIDRQMVNGRVTTEIRFDCSIMELSRATDRCADAERVIFENRICYLNYNKSGNEVPGNESSSCLYKHFELKSKKKTK